jgi:hypothetical protein
VCWIQQYKKFVVVVVCKKDEKGKERRSRVCKGSLKVYIMVIF